MRYILIGRGKMGTLIRETAQAAGDEIQASFTIKDTPGLGPEERALLESLGTCAPVLWSANYSLGVAVLVRALREVSGVLKPDFDIELTETHHNQKEDRRPRPPGRHGGGNPHRPLLRPRRGAGVHPPGDQPPDLRQRRAAHGPPAAR